MSIPRKILPAALLAVASLLTGVTSLADDGDDAKPGWNATVRHDESKARADQETTDTMRMRVFDDIDRSPDHGYRGHRRPGIAIDVESEVVTCPDGYTRIEKLDVGGKEFEIDGECAKTSASPEITIDRSAENAQTDERTADQAAQP